MTTRARDNAVEEHAFMESNRTSPSETKRGGYQGSSDPGEPTQLMQPQTQMHKSGGDVTGGYGPSLPTRLGLCPVHAQEFYMPLDDGDSLTCPECDQRMVIYQRAVIDHPDAR